MNCHAYRGRLLLQLMFWASVLPLIYAVAVHRHFYADGVNFFLQSLANNDFSRWDPPRQNAHFVTQGLQVLLMHSGITKIEILSWAYGFGLFTLPFAILLSAVFFVPPTSRRNLALFILAVHAFIAVNISFFIITEANLGMALAVCLMVYVLPFSTEGKTASIHPVAHTPWANGYAVLLALIATHVYEFFALWGPMILLLAVVRASRTRRLGSSVPLYLVAGLMGWATYVGIYNMLYNAGRTASDAKISEIIVKLLTSPICVLSLIIFSCLCFVWRFEEVNWPLTQRLKIIGGCAFVLGLSPFWTNRALAVELHYPARLYCLAMPFALLFVAWRGVRLARVPQISNLCAALLITLVAFNLGWEMASTTRWYEYRKQFDAVLKQHAGRISVDKTPLAEAPFNWSWTLPTQSIVEGAMLGNTIETLIMPEKKPTWQPFEAYNNDTLPKLTQFGISYHVPVN